MTFRPSKNTGFREQLQLPEMLVFLLAAGDGFEMSRHI